MMLPGKWQKVVEQNGEYIVPAVTSLPSDLLEP